MGHDGWPHPFVHEATHQVNPLKPIYRESPKLLSVPENRGHKNTLKIGCLQKGFWAKFLAIFFLIFGAIFWLTIRGPSFQEETCRKFQYRGTSGKPTLWKPPFCEPLKFLVCPMVLHHLYHWGQNYYMPLFVRGNEVR